MSGPSSDDRRTEASRQLVRQLWLRNRPVTLSRLAKVQVAVEELAAGRLERQRREEAVGEAHKLRGILGTYGFAEGTDLAGEAEELLLAAGGTASAGDLSRRLAAYAATLQDDG